MLHTSQCYFPATRLISNYTAKPQPTAQKTVVQISGIETTLPLPLKKVKIIKTIPIL